MIVRNSIKKMVIRKRKLNTVFLAWYFFVPILEGYSKSIDPILTHMCSRENGVKFWRAFLDCSVLLDPKILPVLNTCIPISNPEQAERTRCSICMNPDHWIKMMECINAHLIELQDQSNPNLELSPGILYKSCVNVLISEVEMSSSRNVPFLPEDDRNLTLNCSTAFS